MSEPKSLTDRRVPFETIAGKTVGGVLLDSEWCIVLFTDGSFAALQAYGYGDECATFKEEDSPSDSDLLAAGVLTQEEHGARAAAQEAKWQQQKAKNEKALEARERHEFERLKAKYESS